MSDQDKLTDTFSELQTTLGMADSCGQTGRDDCEQIQAFRSISTVLDSLDALVYVTDMDTHEILFFNEYGRAIWGDGVGKICWQTLQSGQSGPCDFCTNDKLVDANGQATGVYVW